MRILKNVIPFIPDTSNSEETLVFRISLYTCSSPEHHQIICSFNMHLIFIAFFNGTPTLRCEGQLPYTCWFMVFIIVLLQNLSLTLPKTTMKQCNLPENKGYFNLSHISHVSRMALSLLPLFPYQQKHLFRAQFVKMTH